MSAVPRRPPFLALVAVIAPGPTAVLVLLPSTPGLQRVFATDFGTVQLTLTLYMIGLAVAQLLYGPLSDRIGRRPALIGGLALFLVGSVVCLFAAAIEVLVLGRVIQALGGSAGIVLSRAIIRDLYEREQGASRLAYITMVMVMLSMLSPAVGGYLDAWWGWRSVFVLLLVLGAVVLASSIVFIHETHPPERRIARVIESFTGMGHLLRRRAFSGYAVNVASVNWMYLSFLGGSPYVAVELMGLTPSDYGLAMIISSSGYLIGNLLVGRLAVRVGIDRILSAGAIAMLVGVSALAVFQWTGSLTVLALFGSVAVMYVGHGFIMPAGTAGAVSVIPHVAGAAAGLTGFMQTMAGAAASYLVGHLVASSATPMVAMIIGGAVLGTAAHVFGVLRR